MVLVLVTAGVAGCSKRSPTAPGPGPDPDPTLTLTCPDAVATDTYQSSVAVEYPMPTVVGAIDPVTIACSIPSGNTFPDGTSFVTCYATDAAARNAKCSFEVTVRVVPKLKGVRFLAFGDSITSGEVGDPLTSLRIQVFNPADSYPSLLQTLLQERYRLQTTVMTNAGLGGEFATCAPERQTCSANRLVSEIRTQHPDAVFIMEGANDLNSQIAPELVSTALRDLVRDAIEEGVAAVFISTVTPQVEGRFRAFATPGTIEALNSDIQSWAPAEHAFVVDAYGALAPSKEALISVDGLHPTRAANQVIAETFLAALQSHFEEQPQAVTPPGTTTRLTRYPPLKR